MNTILVPIDFSKTSENALQYAIRLSEIYQATLVLFHSYHSRHGHQSSDDSPEAIWKKNTLWEKELRGVYDRLAAQHQGKVEYYCSGNPMAEELIRLIGEKNIDLVVMGTNGIGSKLVGKFVGTNTSLIAETATCPVLIVPGEKTPGFGRLAYASSYLDTDLPNLKMLSSMAAATQASLTLVHITSLEASAPNDHLKHFETKAQQEVAPVTLSLLTLTGDDVEDTLENYLKTGQTDLLAMSTRQRDFIGKLFDKSLTRIMALHSPIPVLVFHHRG